MPRAEPAGAARPAIWAYSTSAFIGPIELTNYSVVAVVGFMEVRGYRSGAIHVYVFNDVTVYYVGAEASRCDAQAPCLREHLDAQGADSEPLATASVRL